MKVKELIKLLNTLDQNKEIKISHSCGLNKIEDVVYDKDYYYFDGYVIDDGDYKECHEYAERVRGNK